MWVIPSKAECNLPLYKRIVALIENIIENGMLDTERLPSERQLCDLLNVSRSTVVRALEDLADRGILLRRQGSGTYISLENWGLQQYPICNWRIPPQQNSSDNALAISTLISKYRSQWDRKGCRMFDLSKSTLPAELAPTGLIPQETWEDILPLELDEESSRSGLLQLKEAVSEHIAREARLTIPPEELLITSGAQQAFFLITQCLLRPGDNVGIEAPSYFYSLPVFQAAGLRLHPIPMDAEGIQLEALDMLVSRKKICMLFLNPVFQNPTGTVMGNKRKTEIFRFCETRHIPIVEDDSYSALNFSNAADTTPIKRLDAHGRVLYVGSLSSYVGSGIRVGWMAAPRSIVQKLGEVRRHMDFGLSVLPQMLAFHYLKKIYLHHSKELRKKLADKAKTLHHTLISTLDTMAEFEQPQGGFYLYTTHRTKDSRWLVEQLLKNRLVPAYGAAFGKNETGVRLNFAHMPDIFL